MLLRLAKRVLEVKLLLVQSQPSIWDDPLQNVCAEINVALGDYSCAIFGEYVHCLKALLEFGHKYFIYLKT